MNHSLHSADRLTHLKIVVVALIGATVVAGVGIGARLSGGTAGDGLQRVEARAPVVKAGGPVEVSSANEIRAVR